MSLNKSESTSKKNRPAITTIPNTRATDVIVSLLEGQTTLSTSDLTSL
jgi:hypothetical protein